MLSNIKLAVISILCSTLHSLIGLLNTLVLSGVEASDALYESLHSRIDALKEKGITPGLAAILVGENPASQIYVRNKTKKFDSLGLKSWDIYIY